MGLLYYNSAVLISSSSCPNQFFSVLFSCCFLFGSFMFRPQDHIRSFFVTFNKGCIFSFYQKVIWKFVYAGHMKACLIATTKPVCHSGNISALETCWYRLTLLILKQYITQVIKPGCPPDGSITQYMLSTRCQHYTIQVVYTMPALHIPCCPQDDSTTHSMLSTRCQHYTIQAVYKMVSDGSITVQDVYKMPALHNPGCPQDDL